MTLPALPAQNSTDWYAHYAAIDATVRTFSGKLATDPSDAGYDLVLLMGQSNMQGDNTGFDTRTDPAESRVLAYDWAGTYGGQIAGALDPLNHPGGATGVGPGMAFGRWYAATVPTNRRVLLVPVAVSGTPLGATTGNTWNPEITGSLYDQAATQALAALAAAGANSRIVAALWVQGEQDTALGISTPTATYQQLLKELVGQLRADLSLPGLPFIIGGMVPEFISQGATQAAIAGVHAAIPGLVRYTAYVAGPSGNQKGDNLHYTPAGARILGRSMAAAYSSAVGNTTPPVAPVPASRAPGGTTPTDTGPTLITGSGTPAYGVGKFGNALTSGSLTTSGSSITGIRTLEAWVKTAATGVQVACGSSSPNLWLGSNGGSAFVGLPNGNNLQTAVAIGDGAWHHVAVTIDATAGAIVWVDGVNAGSDSAVTAAQTVASGAFGIGAQGANAFVWSGGVDEVRASSTVRYTAGFTPPSAIFTADANTVALYHLNS